MTWLWLEDLYPTDEKYAEVMDCINGEGRFGVMAAEIKSEQQWRK